MTNAISSTPSFLRDAINSYASFSNLQKQDVHKRALRWLQSHIDSELEDKTIVEQFTQKWRTGKPQKSSEELPIKFETLPGSYKGSKSINAHQEEALVFIQENVPLEIQNGFNERWNLKHKLEVSQAGGVPFKVDEREYSVLQQEDPEGNGTGWFLVENKQIYYLLSSESRGDDFLVVLGEEISPQNSNVWFVEQANVKISNV